MSCIRITGNNILPRRKYYLHAGSCLLIIFLLTTEIVCRPQEQGEENFKVADDYPDADEWHHVKLVDGGFQEDHPIIMYKEDFVNEDYDPSQKISSSESKVSDSSKKYKDVGRHHYRKNENKTKTEKYQVVEPEKIYFDILPQSPVVVLDSAEKDSKFDASKIHAELIPLVDEQEDAEAANEELSKDSLRKIPKKYHHRVRRQTSNDEHTVQKRNPYYIWRNVFRYIPFYQPAPYFYPQPAPPKIAVAGHREPTKYKIEIGTRFDGNIVFPDDSNVDFNLFAPSSVRRESAAQRPTQWRDQRPAQQPPQRPAQQPPQRPAQQPPQRPAPQPPRTNTIDVEKPAKRPILDLMHDSNPDNADFSGFTNMPVLQNPFMTESPFQSFTTRRPIASAIPESYLTSTTMRPSRNQSPLTPCVWAIYNCCRADGQEQYNCFEKFGCTGAFVDLNPCAKERRRKVSNFVDEYYK